MRHRLIGMIHLGPLPGSPRFGGNFEEVRKAARADAAALAETGFDALIVENFGDAPFFADDVPKVTIAAMTRAVADLSDLGLPIGVNVLRNDAAGALAVAAATGASFIRVNVLSGVMFTDQGMITGRAAEISRLKASIAPEVAVMADVFVKHATAPPGLTVQQAAVDLWERSGADAVVLSGAGTGRPVDMDRLHQVSEAIPDAPLYIGSGADVSNAAELLKTCAGLIVGTSIKNGGVTTAAIDRERAQAMVEAARQ